MISLYMQHDFGGTELQHYGVQCGQHVRPSSRLMSHKVLLHTTPHGTSHDSRVSQFSTIFNVG